MNFLERDNGNCGWRTKPCDDPNFSTHRDGAEKYSARQPQIEDWTSRRSLGGRQDQTRLSDPHTYVMDVFVEQGSEHRSISMSRTSLESIRSHQYDTDFQLLYPKKIGSPERPTMATIVVGTMSNTNGSNRPIIYAKWPITAAGTSHHARETKLGFFFHCLHYAVGEFAFFHSWIQLGTKTLLDHLVTVRERNGFAKGANNLSSQYFLLSHSGRERDDFVRL